MKAKSLTLALVAVALSSLGFAAFAGNNLPTFKAKPRVAQAQVQSPIAETRTGPAASHFESTQSELGPTLMQPHKGGVGMVGGDRAALAVSDDFEYISGSGWSIKPHKIEFRAGRLAHSVDCPYKTALVAPNPADTGRTYELSPGS